MKLEGLYKKGEKAMIEENNDGSSYIKYDSFKKANWIQNIKAKIVLRARYKMYKIFIEELNPDKDALICDAGVTPIKGITDYKTQTNNFFEFVYPYKDKITATSIEDASYLEIEYPGLTFVRTEPYKTPFSDRQFDVCFCNAVVEHVGSRAQQQDFVNEYCRISKKFFFTTPNKYFPLEMHSMLPFFHWLPSSLFHKILILTGRGHLASESILNLLSAKEFLALFPSATTCHINRIYTAGMVSNLIVYGEWIQNE